jgi:hypothetical protein
MFDVKRALQLVRREESFMLQVSECVSTLLRST